MSALTSLLVRDEVVSVQQIEDALQRQVLEGGEIDTALLELDATTENVLNAYRAAGYQMQPASRAQLMAASPQVLELVPELIVRRYRVVPVAREGHVLCLATGRPLPAGEVRAVQDALGYGIEWRIATEVRVEAALAQHYGIEIAPRMRRLAAHLDDRPAGELIAIEPMAPGLSSTPAGSGLLEMLDDGDEIEQAALTTGEFSAAFGAVAMPPPTMVSEHGVGKHAHPHNRPVEVGRVVQVRESPQLTAAGAEIASGRAQRESAARAFDEPPTSIMPAPPDRMPRRSSRPPPAAARPTPSASPAARSRSRRPSAVPKGPLTTDAARELLEEANDRDAVVEVFFSFSRQYFESTALFAVREDRAIGLEAHNTPQVQDVHELSVIFEPRSTLDELTRTLTSRVIDLSRKETDHALASALGRMHAQPAALIPVCIRQRMVSLVYGDRDGESFRMDDIADLVELLPSVSHAFERIIRNRKLSALQSRRPPPPATIATSSAPASEPAPRSSWTTPPPGAIERPRSASPLHVKGVFPSESLSSKAPEAFAPSLRPHEVPTPAKRRSRPPAATLAGLTDGGPGKHTTTERIMPTVSGGVSLAPARRSAWQEPTASSSASISAGSGKKGPVKDALGALGVPRSAPPPPAARSRVDSALADDASDREELEHSPTIKLPAQTGVSPQPAPGLAGATAFRAGLPPSAPVHAAAFGIAPAPVQRHLSKPPPGAGSYSSAADGGDDESRVGQKETRPSMRALRYAELGEVDPAIETRPIRRSKPALGSLPRAELPDTSEPPAGPRPSRSRPPARSSKMPPGTGAYKAQHLGSETITIPPPAPDPAGHSSVPPSTYRSTEAPSDLVSLPPPPRLPGEATRPKPPAALAPVAPVTGITPAAPPSPPKDDLGGGRRRRRSAEITQPLGPRRHSHPGMASLPNAPDARREASQAQSPAQEIVRMSKAMRESMRPPAPNAAQEPSIIVDAGAQVEQLVIDLCRSGPDDEARYVQQLVRYGQGALPLLAAHFPGPLWFDRKRAHPRLPLGRDVSAIARAFAAFGETAVPQLEALLRDHNPDRRFYATLLVSDQTQPALLSALAERLFDEDPQVRLIVKDTLPQYQKVAGFTQVVETLRSRARDARAAMQDRLAALDAIAVLRDTQSVTLLIEHNASNDKQLSLPAHRALVTITAQDFGNVTRKWTAWHDENRGRHRVEWLIDSLMNSDQALRATAGIELQKLTQVYYGYVAAAPKRDRERAQKRYQDWWGSEGKKRFL